MFKSPAAVTVIVALEDREDFEATLDLRLVFLTPEKSQTLC